MKNSTNQNRVSPAVVILSVALVAAIAVWSWAQTAGYTYTRIATLGVAPNFGDFEAGGINNSGDGVFVSETSKCLDSIFGPSTLCEGVFVNRAGQVSQIVAPGRRLPGGGTFSGFVDGL